jgi:PadR family transcriptional regulator, regulatory protein PadR
LTIVAVLNGEAYGNSIVEEIENQLQRTVNLGGVHVTLYRLEDKGYIKSKVGGSTSVRGGRRKRCYTITASGFSLLKSIKDERQHLWKLIPQLK